MPRTILHPSRAATLLIGRLLASLLEEAPQIALATLGIFGVDDSQWDIVQSCYRVTDGGRRSQRLGSLARDIPSAAGWEPFLRSLRTRHCPVQRIADLLIGPVFNPLLQSDASRTLVCPAADPLGDLIGLVFLVFDADSGTPEGDALTELMDAGARVGGQIAAVLDLGKQATTRMASLAAA